MTSSKKTRQTQKKTSASKAVVVYTKNPSNPPSNKKRASKRKTRPSISKPLSSTDAMIRQYAKLIDDPCNGPLAFLQALSPGVIVKRVRAITTIHSVGANNDGYFVWFPQFHNQANGAGFAFNAFKFEPAALSTNINNTTADPLGTVLATSGTPIGDPGSLLLGSSGTFSTAATVAACLTLHYTGTTTSNSGEIYALTNLRVQSWCNQSGNGPTVANLQTYASKTTRVPMDGLEVKWEPDEVINMRNVGSGTATMKVDDPSADNTCFLQGTAATIASSYGPSALRSNGIGVAWYGLNTANTGEIYLEMTKVVLVELSPAIGAIEAITTTPPPPSMVSTAVKFLDDFRPNWRASLGDAMTHGLASMANMAIAGAPGLAKLGAKLLM